MLTKFKDFETINENLTKARAVLRQANQTQTNTDFIKLRNLLSNNLGYIGKFTEWMFLNKVSYDQLESLYNRIKDVRLSKPIDQFNTVEEVIDSLIRKNSESDLNQMLKAIPSNTRSTIEEDDNFNELKNFLTQHANKKDLIIDFLSKKGGRYGDYDQYEMIEMLIRDLVKIVDATSIEDISKISKSSPHIKFVLENSKVLIVAVDHEGIEKVGSNYWCITEDEHTFSDYVLEGSEPRIQLIFYFKDKIPFVDDQSVLGVTWELLDRRICAAHWEDDEEYDEENEDVISYLRSLNDQLFQIAMDLYDLENTDWLWENKSIYGPKIQNGIEQLRKTGKDSGLVSLLINYVGWCSDNEEEPTNKKFLKDFISTLNSEGIKINLPIDEVINNDGFYKISIFNKSWLDIDITIYVEEYLEYYYEEMLGLKPTLEWLKSNGYDLLGKCDYLEMALTYCKLRLIDIKELLKKYKLKDIIDNDHDDHATSEIFKWLLKNKPEEIIKFLPKVSSKSTINKIFNVLIENSEDHLEEIRNVISLNVRNTPILELISKDTIVSLLSLDDEQIQSAAAYQIIPKELRDLFDIKLTKKTKEVKELKKTKKSKK